MTKVPWCTKGQAQSKVFVATYPGQCASVNQFQSTQAGFVAQLKGKLTTRRYYYGTIFVDHFSRLCYVHFMTAQTSAETVQAKQAYEKFAAERGVGIKHYHCPSPHHAQNVNLVLNLDTGLVSLQFHCRYDDFYETINFNRPDTMTYQIGKFSLDWKGPTNFLL
ncbi:hypothetical protein ACHAW6_005922 [Cyclotella cf. meneghiniana]